MITIEVKKGEPGHTRCECRLEGELNELAVDTIIAINSVYKSIASDRGLNAARMFRAMLLGGIVSPSSPVWDINTGKCLESRKEGQTC